METAPLEPVDVAEVTVLVDNVVDINLPSTEAAFRAPRPYDWSERPPLRAEHGYALLLTVRRGEQSYSLLYDAGLGRDTVLHNMDALGSGRLICGRWCSPMVTPTITADWRASSGVLAAGEPHWSCTPTPGATAAWCSRAATRCICRRPAAQTLKPKGWRWSRSAARRCSWTAPSW